MVDNSLLSNLLPTFINVGLRSLQFGIDIRQDQIRQQVDDVFNTIKLVTTSINTAKKLVVERSNLISRDNLAYFGTVIINAEKALQSLQVLLEPIRVDEQVHQCLRLKTRIQFVALGRSKLPEKINLLMIHYQSLTQVIGTLQSVRMAVGLSNSGQFAVAMDSGVGSNILAVGDMQRGQVQAQITSAPSSSSMYQGSPLLDWKRKSRLSLAESRSHLHASISSGDISAPSTGIAELPAWPESPARSCCATPDSSTIEPSTFSRHNFLHSVPPDTPSASPIFSGGGDPMIASPPDFAPIPASTNDRRLSRRTWLLKQASLTA